MKYSISAFSKATGLSVDTLRYYEKENLIRPRRNASGYREYTEQDVAWAEFLLRLRATDMPIRDITQYAQLRAHGDSTLQARLEMLREHEILLKQRIAEQTKHLEALQAKIRWYEDKLQQEPTVARQADTVVSAEKKEAADRESGAP